MLRTINEQILYIIVTSSIRSQGEFKREYNLSIRLSSKPFNWPEPTVAGTDTWLIMHDYRMIDERSKEHIQSKYQREKENQRENPSAEENNEWNEVNNLLEHRPNDSWTWIHTNG